MPFGFNPFTDRLDLTMTGGGSSNVSTLTGNSGGAVSPTAGNINILGDNTNGINIVGNPGTSTLTVAGIQASATQLGIASFNSTEFTVTSGAVASNPITVTAGTGISVVGSPVNLGGTITISAAASVPTTFTEDSGTATPAANNLNILGTALQGISTSGAGSTVTLTIANASAVQRGVAFFNVTNFTTAAGGVTSNPITLTAGTGISITGSPVNLGGTVTISSTGGGVTWVDVTGATQTLVANTGYVTDHTNVTYTLPASGILGDTIKIVGKLGITTIAQNANQQILMSSSSSTVGVGGSVAGTNVGDCIELICITAGASTVWRADSFVGNWTIT